MSTLQAADPLRVLNRLLAYLSFACCAVVIASFGMFARDQAAGASEHQQTELAAGPAVTSGAAPASHANGQPRRFIDAAAADLTAPFESIVSSHSKWVLHIFPAICALLVYGMGLGFLARFTRGFG
jgi:hypothetical protein